MKQLKKKQKEEKGMVEVAQSIDLKLPEKLRDPAYRRAFFLAESSAKIAADLIALRKKRELNQTELAEKVGTAQTGISRLEKADYQSWSISTLRKIADALDARLRVRIEPAEDVLKEYRSEEQEPEDAVFEVGDSQQTLFASGSQIENLVITHWDHDHVEAQNLFRFPTSTTFFGNWIRQLPIGRSKSRAYREKLALLQAENRRLKARNEELEHECEDYKHLTGMWNTMQFPAQNLQRSAGQQRRQLS